MPQLSEYSLTVKFAGDLTKSLITYTCEIPAFGSGAIVQGSTREQAIQNAELILNCLAVAYAAQGLTLPAADVGA